MNSSDPRTVTAVVNRERARGRLRAVTAGTGVLGLAVAGGLILTLPGSTHATAGAGTSASSSGTSSSSSGTGSSSGSSSSSSGTSGSASSPSSSSGSAHATSGGS